MARNVLTHQEAAKEVAKCGGILDPHGDRAIALPPFVG